MNALVKRVEALESRAGGVNDSEPMFVHLVAMDADENAEITRIWQGNREWDRLPEESEDDFKARAISEAPNAPNCVMVLMAT
ncbi:hypothetical protein PSQ20_21750 [Curvibacter sp. RS43]|uniref:hypothetical protein n=1 Tax=Curvibacter microcysteis TaxID=3026419 RepID=UPI002362738F|nr:hypothetical protein [Curvibacter sp. RS43]MDD0812975.1 hypothetical protein [Curvibacter sp. RS43]